MPNPTLMDIAIANGCDPVVGLIEEVVKAHPELELGAARTIKGLNYPTLVRTALPTVAFRNANEGTAASKSTWERRLWECFILNPRWECDKAVADAHEDGAASYIALEGSAINEAAMITLCSQFYYGSANGGDAKGFPGLIASLDTTNMVVDAAGTAANTGSSLWAVKFGPQAVQWIWGLNGSLALSPVTEQRVLDGSGNPFTAYVQEMLARPGIQVGSKFACGRIKNLTADSGKGLTDALIAKLLTCFPVGKQPDVLLCTRRSLEQLRLSRTATNATGAPAPTPTESMGIPIRPTDAITNTEAIA